MSGIICWFFGRSGAGKSSLSSHVVAQLRQEGRATYLVDGDALRSGVCADLGYDDASRTENHRRAAEMARLASEQGLIVIGATMCPARHHRDLLRDILGDRLRLIHVRASHEVCAMRDPKGLYCRAQKGLVDHFAAQTFQDPTEHEADGVIDTGLHNLEACRETAWTMVKRLL
ncbi:adenylylsulfate kinase [Roseimicrobium gellanilyticum]|uniref:Adenylylsulfate kinase n=1 Tax=Roseimicrobium gellanilyticum TaxID=748857 RepID=A0A366HBJ8_9BACT|nr:adenylyl-sulfate kinase [Roseimicrobium gellanilyticum]RBP39731.1 adenylylsulfate kinase [Roseimicrobium gellanilyticum]